MRPALDSPLDFVGTLANERLAQIHEVLTFRISVLTIVASKGHATYALAGTRGMKSAEKISNRLSH